MALGHSYKSRILRRKYPNKPEYVIEAARLFKKYILQFKNTTK